MSLRDDTEAVLRSWDAHETGRGAAPVIDYDCCPPPAPAAPAASSSTSTGRSARCKTRRPRRVPACPEITAHLAYLRELMGQRTPLDDYVRATQGCPAAGWPDEHVSERGELARARVEALGISWGPDTEHDLEHAEGVIDVAEAAPAIRDAAADLEPAVRAATGAAAACDLSIETVDEDVYWSYWLDGAGRRIRLRINTRRAGFTKACGSSPCMRSSGMRCNAPATPPGARPRTCRGCEPCRCMRPSRSPAKDSRKHSPCSSPPTTRR